MVVVDVPSFDEITCKSKEDGRLLYGIKHSHLETVVPKSDDSYIMIVKGPHKSKIGRVVQRDKTHYTASVQLLNSEDDTAGAALVKCHYDDICQYVGDISEH